MGVLVVKELFMCGHNKPQMADMLFLDLQEVMELAWTIFMSLRPMLMVIVDAINPVQIL